MKAIYCCGGSRTSKYCPECGRNLREPREILLFILEQPLEVLGMPVRVHSILCCEGIRSVRELIAWSEEALLEVPGFGEASLDIVIDALAVYRLALRAETTLLRS